MSAVGSGMTPLGGGDYEALLRTLKHWVEVDDLKKFKLVITSRPDETSPDFP